MATSGSTNFAITTSEIVSAAYRKLGVLTSGQTLDTNLLTDGTFALNLFIKSLTNSGLFPWSNINNSFAMVSGQNTYQIGDGYPVNLSKPLKIFFASIKNSSTNQETPLKLLPRNDYLLISNKSQTGTPIIANYFPKRDFGYLRLYPTPDDTMAAGYVVQIEYQQELQDFDTSIDNPDVPGEMYDMLVHGLALRLAPDCGVPMEVRRQLMQEYALVKQEATENWPEEGSISFQVNTDYGTGY